MSIPALSRSYWARANQPYAANTSAALIAASAEYNLKQLLIDAAAGGSASGLRNSGSVWVVLGSCNSTTAAMDGVDRWTSHTSIVQAASGVAHSWIVLRCTTLGYDCCIDTNSATTANLRVAFTPSSTPFSGGTTTNGPTSTEEFTIGTASVGVAANAALIGDAVTLNSNFSHFVCADTGEFIFTCSRSGGLVHTTIIAFQKPTGGEPGDTRNAVAIGVSNAATGRGSPTTASFNSPLIASQRCPGGALIASGGFSTLTFGGTNYTGTGATSTLTGNYLTYPLRNFTITPQVADRGSLQDMYLIGTVAVNSSYPSVGASQTHIVVGDLVIPFPVVLPTV